MRPMIISAPGPGRIVLIDVVVLSEQRPKDAHDAQENDDPDDDDGDQKEDQEPKATAVTLSHDDHLWRWWGCLAHNGFSLGCGYRLRLKRPSVVAWHVT